jgi:hypothetical protein
VSNVPFAWQDKRVLRHIREQCEDPASALAVYHALTVVASDKQAESFQTTHAWLAALAGFSERTVRARVHDLERIGAVAVETPPLRAPSTYRLLPFGNGCPTSGNGCRAFGNREAPPLPPSEEKKKRIGGSASRPATSKFSPPTIAEVLLEASKNGLPESEARRFVAYYQSNGWRVGRNPMKNWRAALTNWRVRWEGDRRPAGTQSPAHDRRALETERRRLESELPWQQEPEASRSKARIRELETAIATP